MARRRSFKISTYEAKTMECLYHAVDAADHKLLFLRARKKIVDEQMADFKRQVEELEISVKAQEAALESATKQFDEARASLEKRFGIDLSRYNIDSDTGVLSPARGKKE